MPIAPRKIIFIVDPITARIFVIDPKEQVTREFLLSSHGSHLAEDGAQELDSQTGTSVRVEHLGQRGIGDLLCTGIRRTPLPPPHDKASKRTGHVTTETWSSVDLGVVVDSLTRDPERGSVHYFLRGVGRNEPSPERFVPPLNYKVEQIRSAK
jgi:hypothetical protein